MKCLVCGGKMRRQEHTTYTYASEGDGETIHVIITDVPAGVCAQCGERVYAPETTDQLLDIIRRARERKPAPRTIEVPLYSLAGTA